MNKPPEIVNNGLLVSIWLINYMYNSCSQYLIAPLPTFPQWLSVKIVSASIIVVGFIRLFSYSMKVMVASKLITLVKFRNNTRPKIPKVSILLFSSVNIWLPLHPSKTYSIIFHFKPPVLFSNILCRYGILVNLANLVNTLLGFWWK